MERAGAALASAARAQLTAALSTLPGSNRRLYVDDTLFCTATNTCPLLSFFTTPDSLRRAHGIAQVAPLSRATPGPGPAVLLLRPGAAAARRAAAALAAGVAGPAPGPALVLVTPRRSRSVELVLAAAVGAGTVRVAALPLGFVPFDDALVTLAWPRAFSEVVLEGNNSAILAAAHGLHALSDALDVDFAVVRMAGAAGMATVDKFLEIADRFVPTRPARAIRGSPRSAISRPLPRSPPPSASGSIMGSTVASGVGSAAGSVVGSRAGSISGSRVGSTVGSVVDVGGASEDDASDVASDAPSRAEDDDSLWFSSDVSIARVLAGTHMEANDKTGPGGDDGAGAATHPRKKPIKLVVIDRNVDVVTPLLTQWTYEGLLDEAVGLLRGNVMDIGFDEFMSEDAAGMLGADAPSAATSSSRSDVMESDSISGISVEGGTKRTNRRVQKRLRKDGDPIFGQLRDLNYWAAARLIGSVASSVQAYYDNRPDMSDAIVDVKHYVKALPEVKSEHFSAAVHTAIAAEVSARTFEQAAFKRRFDLEREMLEGSSASGRRVLLHDAICRNEPLSHVLRLVCLWSLTGGGIDAEAFEFLRREIVATYGLSVLSLLGALERAGLLTRSARVASTSGMPWSPFVKFGFGSEGNGSGPGGAGVSPEKPSSGPSGPSMPASVVGYSWQFVRAAMHLLTDFEPEASDSGGLEGPYSGYVPLTVRLVDAGISREGWSKLPRIASHTLLLPPGHTVSERSVAGGTIAPDDSAGPQAVSAGVGLGVASDIDAVVLFVGGVARAEASAVRAVAARAGQKVLIATTDVYGANQFVTMT